MKLFPSIGLTCMIGLMAVGAAARTPILKAAYGYSSEGTYVGVVIDGKRLAYTYNARNSRDKPGQINMEQRPHYTKGDLVTETVTLSQKELAALADLIKTTGFMKLAQPKPPNTRSYPTGLSVILGPKTHAITHYSGRVPKAFEKVATAIRQLVNKHCKHKLP